MPYYNLFLMILMLLELQITDKSDIILPLYTNKKITKFISSFVSYNLLEVALWISHI